MFRFGEFTRDEKKSSWFHIKDEKISKKILEHYRKSNCKYWLKIWKQIFINRLWIATNYSTYEKLFFCFHWALQFERNIKFFLEYHLSSIKTFSGRFLPLILLTEWISWLFFLTVILIIFSYYFFAYSEFITQCDIDFKFILKASLQNFYNSFRHDFSNFHIILCWISQCIWFW